MFQVRSRWQGTASSNNAAHCKKRAWMLTDICSPPADSQQPGTSGHWEQPARCRQTSGAVWHADQGNWTRDLPITRRWIYPWDSPVIILLSYSCTTEACWGYQPSVGFQAKMSNIFRFQLLKWEDFFLVFFIYEGKSRVYGFWTKDISLWCGDTKTVKGIFFTIH